MPIKPENRARYPKDWKQIVAKVRERSGDRCEGSPDFPTCRRRNGRFLNKRTNKTTDDPMLADAWFCDGDAVIRIVLTTAHLDHVPENCSLENLRHWCQRCHLNYDKHHHMQTAYASRRSGRAAGDLLT